MKAKDLRNSILQMAVQGKLVPQDPNDEPASALVERIRAERAKLIKEKKIKAPKGGESVIYRSSDGSHYEKRGKCEPVCIDDEIPFEIPESWEWCRYFTIADTLAGFAFKSSEFKTTGRYRLLRGINLGINQIRWDDTVFVDEITSKAAAYKLKTGDVLLGLDRPWITGGLRTAIIEDAEDTYLVQRVLRVRQTSAADARWLQLLLTTPLLSGTVAQGMTGISVPHISEGQVTSILVPLPPINEQRRIVYLITRTMNLIDDYGALEDARERLDAELPDRLRKSILQLAVQGKLVPQDPADEPASVLLDHIRAERARLIKEKRIRAPKGGESIIYRASDGGYYEKRGKGVPVCIDDEIPFEIPENWAWARLGTVFEMQAGKNIAASEISKVRDEAHPYQCFGGNGVRGYVESPNRNGQFPIVGRQGALCGCINYAEGEFYATEHAVVTTCFCETDVSWACIFLEAVNLNQYATATAQPGLAVSKIIEVLIPVPPAEEQSRIVRCYRRYRRLTNQ